MDGTRIDISKLRKCDVLAALYNEAQPLGMGYAHYTPGDMTPEQAQEILASMDDMYLSFDYLNGRVMKVDLTGDVVETRLYDRDNGAGVGAGIIDGLRTTG